MIPGRKRTLGDTVPESERARTLVLDASAALARLVRHFADGEHVEIGRDAAAELVALASAAAVVAADAIIPARETPPLNNDVTRIIAEFVLARRACTTFGAGGVVQTRRSPFYDYACRAGWDIVDAQLRALRLISRQWRAVVTPLVRCIWLPPAPSDADEAALIASFAHVRRLGGHFPDFLRYVAQLRTNHGDAMQFLSLVDAGSSAIVPRDLRVETNRYPGCEPVPIRDDAGRLHHDGCKLTQLLREVDVVRYRYIPGHDFTQDISNVRAQRLYIRYNEISFETLRDVSWPDGFELHIDFSGSSLAHTAYEWIFVESCITHIHLHFDEQHLSVDELANFPPLVLPPELWYRFRERFVVSRDASLYNSLFNRTGLVLP